MLTIRHYCMPDAIRNVIGSLGVAVAISTAVDSSDTINIYILVTCFSLYSPPKREPAGLFTRRPNSSELILLRCWKTT